MSAVSEDRFGWTHTFDAFTALMYAPHVQTSRPTGVVSLTRCVTCNATRRSLIAFVGVKTVRTALIVDRFAGRRMVEPVVPFHVKWLGWYHALSGFSRADVPV